MQVERFPANKKTEVLVVKTKRFTFKQKLEFLRNFDQLSDEEKKNVADKYGIDVSEVKAVLEDACYDCYKLTLNQMIILFKEVEKMICEKSDQIDAIERVNNETIDDFLYSLRYGIEWKQNKKKIANEIDKAIKATSNEFNQQMIEEGNMIIGEFGEIVCKNNYLLSAIRLRKRISAEMWKKYEFEPSDELKNLYTKLNNK